MKLLERIRASYGLLTGKLKLTTRRLSGAILSRISGDYDGALAKINLDLDTDLLEVVKRCRNLAKNEPIIRAYLSACVKNIVRQDRLRATVSGEES